MFNIVFPIPVHFALKVTIIVTIIASHLFFYNYFAEAQLLQLLFASIIYCPSMGILCAITVFKLGVRRPGTDEWRMKCLDCH